MDLAGRADLLDRVGGGVEEEPVVDGIEMLGGRDGLVADHVERPHQVHRRGERLAYLADLIDCQGVQVGTEMEDVRVDRFGVLDGSTSVSTVSATVDIQSGVASNSVRAPR